MSSVNFNNAIFLPQELLKNVYLSMAGLTDFCYKGFTYSFRAELLGLWSLEKRKEGDTLGTGDQYPYHFLVKAKENW